MSYDPGTATTPRQLDETTWAVDSFKSDTTYLVTVTPTETRCTCPHWVTRIAPLAGEGALCKHGKAVHAHLEATKPTALEAASAKVKALTEAELLRLAQYYQGQAAGAACWLELAARQAAAEQDAELRRLFS